MGTPGSGYNVKPWAAFRRCGLFANIDFNTAAALADGDQQISMDGFPPNILAQVIAAVPSLATPGDPSVGRSKKLIFDPLNATGDGPIEIEIATFEDDPATIINLVDPLVLPGGPHASPVDIGMKFRSPSVLVGNSPKRVEFVLTCHALDDRGGAACSTPDMSFEIFMAVERDGQYFLKTGILSPPVVAPAGGVDGIGSVTVDLPALNYLQVEVTPGGGDGGDTVFTLEMVRSER